MASPNQETDPAHEDASKQFAPPRSGKWVETALQYRYAIVILLVFAWVFGQKAWAAEFTKASDCVVGQRVVNRDKQAGVIVKADGSSCHVKLDATGKTDYNIFWMLRPEKNSSKAADSPSQRDPSAGQSQSGNTNPASTGLQPGKYTCYMLTSGALNYAFIDIHIDSPSRYRDKSGKSGGYSIDGNQKITFTGPLAAANAKLLPGPRIGLNMNGGKFFNTSCSMKK
jgi:hypothetical protein